MDGKLSLKVLSCCIAKTKLRRGHSTYTSLLFLFELTAQITFASLRLTLVTLNFHLKGEDVGYHLESFSNIQKIVIIP